MLEHTLRFTIPAAYALLPPVMASPAATALLLCIGLQESRFEHRRQRAGGPARGFMQFERGGIVGVLQHERTAEVITSVLWRLQYRDAIDDAKACHRLVEHNDTLALVFGRLLLWTLPDPLTRDAERSWKSYLKAWRPGKARPETWATNFNEAWDLVEAQYAPRNEEGGS